MATPLLRWVAPVGVQLTVGRLLNDLGSPRPVLSAGGVFVNRTRVTDEERQLTAGDIVEVYAQSGSAEPCTVLERRGDLVAIEKPAGLASEPTHESQGHSVAEQLAARFGRPVHVASRLDVGVSGLMLVALSAGASSHIERLRARGAVARRYLALGAGSPDPSAGCWQWPLEKGGRSRAAQTRYRVLAALKRDQAPTSIALLLLEPVTGRTHQLRLHCRQAGAPLLGDRRHGGPIHFSLPNGTVRSTTRLGLHAYGASLLDMDGKPWILETPPPGELVNLWEVLGGAPGDFQLLAPSRRA